jgi:hypothetical protein
MWLRFLALPIWCCQSVELQFLSRVVFGTGTVDARRAGNFQKPGANFGDQKYNGMWSATILLLENSGDLVGEY